MDIAEPQGGCIGKGERTETATVLVLGINLSHDGSACLVEDGKVVVAIAEERLDGTKRSSHSARVHKKGLDWRLPPLRSIAYCLAARNIGIDDLDLIIADNAFEPVNTNSLKTLLPIRDKSKIHSIPHPSHHLAHAYSTYFCSPFRESAILIADTFGSETLQGTEAESGYYASACAIEPVLKNFQVPWSTGGGNGSVYYSLTYIYNFISLALGFTSKRTHEIVVSEAGKTMGLSAYGKPRDDWPRIIEFHRNEIRSRGFTQWALDRNVARIRKGALVPIVRPKRCALSQFHMDLAYFVQAEFERGMLFLANRLHDITRSKNLCIAGGAGLNSVVNKAILEKTPFENVFIQPASTDDGTAIGCAMYGWHELAQQRSRSCLKHMYLGVDHGRDAVRSALKSRGMAQNAVPETELIRRTARYLAAGKIVGWFHGGSEFGPRALGHRSILGDPRRPGMKDMINRKVKHRESFRPYAPAVLAEFAKHYFELVCPSPYMLFVAKAIQSKAAAIPAVVHVDGTARVQTVSEDSNGLLYKLLREFHRLTSVPILLNTSLNTRGMPIVETPDDALDLFFDSAMQVLVIEGFICDKTEKETMVGLVQHYVRNEKPDKALTQIKKVIKTWPDDGALYPLLAKCQYACRNYRQAIDAAAKALEFNVSEPDIGLHTILGISYEKVGDFDRAIPELKKAESLDRENEHINVSLTRCYLKTKQVDLMKMEIVKGYDKVSNKRRWLTGEKNRA